MTGAIIDLGHCGFTIKSYHKLRTLESLLEKRLKEHQNQIISAVSEHQDKACHSID